MTRYLVGFMCVLALGVMGCGDSEGTGGSGGAGGDGGSGGGGEIATLQVLPMELDAEGEQVRLVGVSVCEADTTNCAVSDGLVPVELQVPANQEISYTQTKDGFDSRLRSDIMPPGLTIVVPVMVPAAQVAEQFERLMSPYPMVGTGAVSVLVWGSAAGDPIPGATLDLVDGTGKPYYANDDGTWNGDLTATTIEGSGGFVDVDPGEVEVRVGGAAKTCEVFRGWPGTEANSIRMAVREGFRTSARLLCSR